MNAHVVYFFGHAESKRESEGKKGRASERKENHPHAFTTLSLALSKNASSPFCSWRYSQIRIESLRKRAD